MTRGRFPALLLLPALIVLVHAAAGAQDTPSQSLTDRLTVHLDFEKDIDPANFPVEMNPQPVVGRWHPQNVRVKLDAGQSRSGGRSFLMELDGIGNIYETEQAYRFDPRFSYRLTGYIRTENVPETGLRATSARIALVGLGPDRKTIVWSTLTRGVTGTSDWTCVSLDIPRDVTRAFRWVRIRTVIDGVAIGGRVWFDDVTLTPLPRILTRTASPEGFISPDDAARVDVSLDTLIAEDYQLSAELISPTGERVMKQSQEIKPGVGFVAEAGFTLPFRAFGLYRLRMDLESAGRAVSSVERSLLYWPGAAGTRSSRAWGVYAGGIGRLGSDRVAMLLESNLGTVAVDLFDGDGSDNVTTLAFRAASQFGTLRQHGVHPVVVLDEPPASVVNAVFSRKLVSSASQVSWLRILSLDSELWANDLIAAVKPLASRTEYWQIGRAADHRTGARDLTRAADNLRRVLTPVTYRRKIGVVFDGSESPDVIKAAAACDFVVLNWSGQIDAEWTLPVLISQLRSVVGEVWVSLPVSSTDVKAEKVVERMVWLRGAGADRVILDSLEGGLVNAWGNPTETAAAAATAAREIGDTPFAGVLTTRAWSFIFAGPTGAKLAVVTPPGTPSEILYLGKDLRRTDLFGNVSALRVLDGKAVLSDGVRPYFVSGLDGEAMATRQSLRLGAADSPTGELRAELRPQPLRIQLASGFRVPTTGTIEILPPPGWHVRDTLLPVRIEPGRPIQLETQVEVPITEAADDHVFLTRISLADREMVVSAPVALKPRGIDTDISVRKEAEGVFTVTQKITNRDDRPARLVLFVASADTGRLEHFVNGLGPGASTEVPFRLEKVTSPEVWVGWRERAGSRFFNRYLTLTTSDE